MLLRPSSVRNGVMSNFCSVHLICVCGIGTHSHHLAETSRCQQTNHHFYPTPHNYPGLWVRVPQVSPLRPGLCPTQPLPGPAQTTRPTPPANLHPRRRLFLLSSLSASFEREEPVLSLSKEPRRSSHHLNSPSPESPPSPSPALARHSALSAVEGQNLRIGLCPCLSEGAWGFSPTNNGPWKQRALAPGICCRRCLFFVFPVPCSLHFLSRPSTLQNPPNQLHSNHLKLKNSWHSSFPQARIIKAVEMREKPGACVGLLLSSSAPYTPSFVEHFTSWCTPKTFILRRFSSRKTAFEELFRGIGPGIISKSFVK